MINHSLLYSLHQMVHCQLSMKLVDNVESFFQNEIDVKNLDERVHIYRELFQLYPCEECGFRVSDIKELLRTAIRKETILRWNP